MANQGKLNKKEAQTLPTIKRSQLAGKRATDNVQFKGGTYRIDTAWRYLQHDTVKLAKTDRGAECIEDFTAYQIIEDKISL